MFIYNWNGLTSNAFSVSRGVRQGGVLSPILFTLYIDNLLKELSHSNVGCYWKNIFVGALAYADDLTLLAPSPSALRNSFPYVKNLALNSGLNLILIRPSALGSVERDLEDMKLHFSSVASISCRCVEYVSHLGHIISYDLQNDLDIQRCKRDFIRQANSILSHFVFLYS